MKRNVKVIFRRTIDRFLLIRFQVRKAFIKAHQNFLINNKIILNDQ